MGPGTADAPHSLSQCRIIHHRTATLAGSWKEIQKEDGCNTGTFNIDASSRNPLDYLSFNSMYLYNICREWRAPVKGLWTACDRDQNRNPASFQWIVSSTFLVEIRTRNLTQSPNTRPFFSRERRQLGALAVPSRHKASHRRWMREEWFSSIGHRASVCALHTSARSIIISAPASPRITDKVNNTNNHSLQLQPYGRHT